jgi:hypothetical protein
MDENPQPGDAEMPTLPFSTTPLEVPVAIPQQIR